MKEIKRAYNIDKFMPQKMVQYLIGTRDYYKIVSHDSKRTTYIRSFNMHRTLNKASTNKSPELFIPIVELPTELVQIQFKEQSLNTVEMYLNNGWQLSFRIHNASTRVEPSLKFDIQFIGMPFTIYTFPCEWN